MQKQKSQLSCHLMQTTLSVAQTRSPTLSARQLGFSVTTVYRHIDALEHSLGVQVFDRHHSGWSLRAAAYPLLSASEQIEQLLQLARSEIQDAAGVASARLRIAVSQDMATHFVVPHLRAFCQSGALIQPELIVASSFNDLVRGEADVAIRPHGDPGDSLIGRKVCAMSHAFYGSRSYFRRHGRTARGIQSAAHINWTAHDICGFGQTLSEYRAAQWLEDNIPTGAITARFDCTSTLARAVSEGVGIGLLPCFVGDRISSLRAFAKIDGGLPIDIWLVTAAANRKRDNVKSFFKFFAASLRAQKALFKGAPYNS